MATSLGDVQMAVRLASDLRPNMQWILSVQSTDVNHLEVPATGAAKICAQQYKCRWNRGFT
jgi:hypothetical protein